MAGALDRAHAQARAHGLGAAGGGAQRSAIALSILRVEERAFAFNVIDIATRVATIAVVAGLLLAWSRTSTAFLIGCAIVEGCVLLANWFLLMRRNLFSVALLDFGLLRSYLTYSLPIMAAEIAFVLLAYSDRALIEAFLGAEHSAISPPRAAWPPRPSTPFKTR